MKLGKQKLVTENETDKSSIKKKKKIRKKSNEE